MELGSAAELLGVHGPLVPCSKAAEPMRADSTAWQIVQGLARSSGRWIGPSVLASMLQLLPDHRPVPG